MNERTTAAGRRLLETFPPDLADGAMKEIEPSTAVGFWLITALTEWKRECPQARLSEWVLRDVRDGVTAAEREAVRTALERLRERVAALPGKPCSCSAAICDEHAELCVAGRCEDWPGAKLAVLAMIDEEVVRRIESRGNGEYRLG